MDLKNSRIALNKVWIETGIIENGIPQLKEVTEQVLLICNLLSSCDKNKTNSFFEFCHQEARRLSDNVIVKIDDIPVVTSF